MGNYTACCAVNVTHRCLKRPRFVPCVPISAAAHLELQFFSQNWWRAEPNATLTNNFPRLGACQDDVNGGLRSAF